MRQFSRRLLICRGTSDQGIEACSAKAEQSFFVIQAK